MKKLLASAAFIIVFAAYAFSRQLGSASAQNIASASGQQASTSAAPPAPQNSTSQAAPQSAPSQPIASAPQGQYRNGTYTGSVADAYYGLVQVQATVSGGKLTDVQFLQYPSDRSTSRYINSQAMPLLTQEAIQAQSANVSGVSGATDTSGAFVQSLGSALSQASA